MSLSYRANQLWWNISAGPLPETVRQEIEQVLNRAQYELFTRFEPSDQWHAFRVYRTLQELEYSQPDLMTAALIHDVGKTRVNLSVWDRILIVTAARLLPHKSTVWGQGDIQGWKRPFVVRACHPLWGADMARSAGSTELTIELIARHQEPIVETSHVMVDELLRVLQWADDLN